MGGASLKVAGKAAWPLPSSLEPPQPKGPQAFKPRPQLSEPSSSLGPFGRWFCCACCFGHASVESMGRLKGAGLPKKHPPEKSKEKVLVDGGFERG